MNTQTMPFFDTLSYANALRKAGFTKSQAEILAEKNKEIFENNMATRYDLKVLQGELETRMESIKSELFKWFIGALVAQTAIIVSLIKFL